MTRAKRDLKSWAREHMRGVENTLLPSFTPDLSELDEAGIRHDVRQSIAHGFFSMMCATETGLSLEEAQRLVSIAVDEAGDDIVVTTSLILNNFDENMALMEHAEKVGAQGVLLGYPPVFHPVDKEEVYTATKRFLDATSLHVTLYPSPHFPFSKFHNSGFPLDVMERLAEIDNVVAVKIGELGMFADVMHRIGDKVLVGCPVERYVPLLQQGFGMQWMGAGCYEVLQSPDKPYLVEYFDLLMRGKVDAAMEIYWKLAPMRNLFEEQFNKTVMTGTYNWHQQKFYQWCVGGNGGITRQPAMKLHQWEIDTIKMGFYAIDIVPRDNDQEFFVGRKSWERLHGAEPPAAQQPLSAPSVSVPPTASGTPRERARTLVSALTSALAETEAEFQKVPMLIRPMLKTTFESKTGRDLRGWRSALDGLARELEADDGAVVGVDGLERLRAYWVEAPEQAGRMAKDDAEREAIAARMSERAALVGELSSALGELGAR